jgi:hypothetical protein
MKTFHIILLALIVLLSLATVNAQWGYGGYGFRPYGYGFNRGFYGGGFRRGFYGGGYPRWGGFYG